MEFEARERAIYVPAAGTLVCADLHIGKDSASNVELRLGEHEDIVGRFEALLERYEPSETVIAGDLLHSFHRLPTGATETVRALEAAAETADCRLLVTPGNHDTMLETLWDGPTPSEYRLGGTDIVVLHGHEPPGSDAEWYVIGHDHPTIEIEGVRHPCYLYGSDQYRGAGVLMLPSFSRLPAGAPVNGMYAGDFMSPLVTDESAMRPIVRDEDSDETHEFPPLEEFRRLL